MVPGLHGFSTSHQSSASQPHSRDCKRYCSTCKPFRSISACPQSDSSRKCTSNSSHSINRDSNCQEDRLCLRITKAHHAGSETDVAVSLPSLCCTLHLAKPAHIIGPSLAAHISAKYIEFPSVSNGQVMLQVEVDGQLQTEHPRYGLQAHTHDYCLRMRTRILQHLK